MCWPLPLTPGRNWRRFHASAVGAAQTMIMFSSARLVHIGDATLLIPVAAAITTLLLLNRVWRLSIWWTLSFSAGLALVIASKIAYMGWGVGIKAIDYKAVSGHAMLTAAVLPVLFQLILWQQNPRSRHGGEWAGLVLAMVVSVVLVTFGFHTWSEAIAGSILGCLISLPFLREASATAGSFRLRRWTVTASASMLLLMHEATLMPATQYWMSNIATYLSGHDLLYSWHSWERSD